MATAQSSPPALCRERVVRVERRNNAAECITASGKTVLLSILFAVLVDSLDELTFPIPVGAPSTGTEIHLTKTASGRKREVYQAPIVYVTEPKRDKRQEYYVSAEVRGSLGISRIFLANEVLRSYFYSLSPRSNEGVTQTLYDVLRISSDADPEDLRVGFKLRQRELQAEEATQRALVALERAYNIVGQPELRACYDALLKDPEAPALFPYGGVGSLIVEGERSREGDSFFAQRIVSFVPVLRERRFRAPVRKCEFYDHSAYYRDAARKLDVWFDLAVIHVPWNADWNRWKHLLPAKMDVEATFVQTSKYRRRKGQFELTTWETAVPSRLRARLPGDFAQQVAKAKQLYQRFGQFSSALDRIRVRIEHEPVERAELNKMCGQLNIPGDFDVSMITWRPDYDPLFYRLLAARARRIYLFRGEYIFDVEKGVVVETPELGHATYLFSKPRSMESFLALYAKLSKDDIRKNRNNAAEKLGFRGRVVHGSNPRQWNKELRQKLGEKPDHLADTDALTAERT